MMRATTCRPFFLALLAVACCLTAVRADDEHTVLARKAQNVLKANCYRCHGQDGAVEGGMNYVLDLDKLVARKKVVPGQPDKSPLYNRVINNIMPPGDEQPRPSDADKAILKQWIEAGAPHIPSTVAAQPAVTEADVLAAILADLEKMDKRSRRFQRYFNLSHLANAGLGEDELQTYRNAVSKLINSLSWHPKVTVPVAIDARRTVLRIDLRDFMWDASLWNRLLNDYPYGVFQDSATARAVAVATATRMPYVRADWFVATASRAPLYYDLLQIPGNISELERQLRVDVTADIQQERVARAGFNGSGVSRNNRVLERHDAVHGAYWRTYDFEAIPQNLADRENLLPDRRNLFAYPLGPGAAENNFQHAGGEVIFNLPNGLHAFVLINSLGVRLDKAPIAIVSDPKRPDRAVESGLSCMSCHIRGINQKADQIRDYVDKNPKAFSRADAELIRALYVPEAKMKALMDSDAERFRKAVELTGAKIGTSETIMTMTLRYEADLDLPTAAGEVGMAPEAFLQKIGQSETLSKNLGALRVAGGTVQRQVVIQALSDTVRELRLGTLFNPAQVGQQLPDNTGEIDPLEARNSQANSMVFSADGRIALFASADKTVHVYDVDAGRELRRMVGHTASVWAVAFSADGKFGLSGGADNTVRLWDVALGREEKRLEGHSSLVLAVDFSPDGKRALSSGYDQTVVLWDLAKGQELRRFENLPKTVHCLAFTADGAKALFGDDKALHLYDLSNGKKLGSFDGHADAVTCLAISDDGKRVLTGSDDATVRLWDIESRQLVRTFDGHEGPVKSVAFHPDGKHLLSGGNDATLRVWDGETGKQLGKFGKHVDAVLAVVVARDGKQSISGSRDAVVLPWSLTKALKGMTAPVATPEQPTAPATGELKPLKVLPVGGTVGSLFLSADRKGLYYLNLSENKAAHIDTAAFKRDRWVQLAEGTELLVRSPDGKGLYAIASVHRHGKRPLEGKVQVIDPGTLELRKTLTVESDPYDAAASDAGHLYLSGGTGDWTDVTVLDVANSKVTARWGGIWNKSFLRLSPAQDRLLISSQGVSPGTLDTMLLPTNVDDKPVQYRGQAREDRPFGGDFVVSPDGKFLLHKNGTVVRLAPERDDDLAPVAMVAPFLAAVVAPEPGAAFVLTADGALKQYSYPEFKPRGEYRLGTVGYQAALDAKEGKLYVAAFNPQVLIERGRPRGAGDLHVYDVKALLGDKGK